MQAVTAQQASVENFSIQIQPLPSCHLYWHLGCNFATVSDIQFGVLKPEGSFVTTQIDRRAFLLSSGIAAVAVLTPNTPDFASASTTSEPFQWKTGNLIFSFEVQAGKLRQQRLVPAGVGVSTSDNSSGVEVALQCSGENSPDQGMKSGVGQPGARLLFSGHREESTARGKRLVCVHTDSLLKINVESVYESFGRVRT